MGNIRGSVIAISGAGNGIGRALALSAARAGAHLALSDIQSDPLQRTAAEARGNGVHVSARVVDVASRDAVDAWAKAAASEHGGIDTIINNAGVALLDTLEDVPYEQFQWAFNIIYWGVVHGTRAFLPYVKARHGSVVNMGSIHSFIATPNNGPYCAAKSAVRGFSDALREELRPYGVNVMLVMPGAVRTDIVRNARINKFVHAESSREDINRAHYAAAFTSPEATAQIVLRAIQQRRGRVLVGWDAVFYDGLTRILPTFAHRAYGWGARKLSEPRPAPRASTSGTD